MLQLLLKFLLLFLDSADSAAVIAVDAKDGFGVATTVAAVVDSTDVVGVAATAVVVVASADPV